MKTQSENNQNQRTPIANDKAPDLKGSGVYAAAKDKDRTQSRDGVQNSSGQGKDTRNSQNQSRQNSSGNQKNMGQANNTHL